MVDQDINASDGESSAAGAGDWRPPYVPYTTLVGLIDDKLGTNPLPPRVDRGLLDTYAGSVQAMLLATLKTTGLIGEDGTVLEPLKVATRNPASRQAVLKAWAQGFYIEQLELARQNATAQMLHESFARRKVTGSTLRKAVVFFLSLSDDVGLPKSPHFKPPRQTSSGVARPRKKAAAQPPTIATAGAGPVTPKSGETIRVDLGDAGAVTVNVDVRWLQLPIGTFTQLRSVIGELEALGVSREPEDARTTAKQAE